MIKLWIGGTRKIPLKCNIILHLVATRTFALEGGTKNDLVAIKSILIVETLLAIWVISIWWSLDHLLYFFTILTIPSSI
jgi:hypothetical protein